MCEGDPFGKGMTKGKGTMHHHTRQWDDLTHSEQWWIQRLRSGALRDDLRAARAAHGGRVQAPPFKMPHVKEDGSVGRGQCAQVKSKYKVVIQSTIVHGEPASRGGFTTIVVLQSTMVRTSSGSRGAVTTRVTSRSIVIGGTQRARGSFANREACQSNMMQGASGGKGQT